MARMLGVARQPFCGKCCGESTKCGNMKQKRAERRNARQMFKRELDNGDYDMVDLEDDNE